MRIAIVFASALSLAACSSGANHLGNPLLWPVNAVTTGIENSIYDAQRNEVEDYVALNHSELLANIEDGGGPVLRDAFELVQIPPSERGDVIEVMQEDIGILTDNPDHLVVTLMVNSN